MTDLAARLREFNPQMLQVARESRGMSMSALARSASMTANKVFRLEVADWQPTEDELRRLSFALRFPVEFFFQTDLIYGPSYWEAFHFHRNCDPVPPRTKRAKRT